MKKFQPLGGGGPRKGPPTKRLGTCGRPLILSDQERFRRDSCSQGDGNDDMAVVRAPLVPGLLTTAPVSLKVRQKFRPLGVGGRRANELLKNTLPVLYDELERCVSRRPARVHLTSMRVVSFPI